MQLPCLWVVQANHSYIFTLKIISHKNLKKLYLIVNKDSCQTYQVWSCHFLLFMMIKQRHTIWQLEVRMAWLALLHSDWESDLCDQVNFHFQHPCCSQREILLMVHWLHYNFHLESSILHDKYYIDLVVVSLYAFTFMYQKTVLLIELRWPLFWRRARMKLERKKQLLIADLPVNPSLLHYKLIWSQNFNSPIHGIVVEDSDEDGLPKLLITTLMNIHVFQFNL